MTKPLEKFVLDLPGYYTLTEKQQRNASQLIAIAKKFHEKAKIPFNDTIIESDRTIILESGHQPNFLPHSGTYKKAFCLNWIQNILKEKNNDTVAFFGLADQNISTARVLTKNQVPALNKDGLLKIGFKINNEDKFKSFCSVPKPTPELWEQEMGKIQNHYREIAKKTRSADVPSSQSDFVNALLWDSYKIADNFAELNSIIFARLCTDLLGINLCFFRYSDMSHEKIFLEESREILRHLGFFNHTYNRMIEQKRLDIPQVNTTHIPFWYNCPCGSKLELSLNDMFTSSVNCPYCNTEHEINFGDDFYNLARYYDRLDFNAVSRNIAMAHGLGDSLFISGFGGSLAYGQISDQISQDFGFHRPITFGWRSGDYYLGMAHSAAVHELMKYFSLTSSDFLAPELNNKVAYTFRQISENIRIAESRNNQKDMKYWSGMLGNAKNRAVFAQKLFSMTPSFLDILANQQIVSVRRLWGESLEHAEIQIENGFHMIRQDINYQTDLLSDIPSDNLSLIYKNIRNIEVG